MRDSFSELQRNWENNNITKQRPYTELVDFEFSLKFDLVFFYFEINIFLLDEKLDF